MLPDGKFVDRQGRECWCLNGKLHREDGPAVILKCGTEYWYKDGNIHREDGPAIIYADGSKVWYISGTPLDPLEWLVLAGNTDTANT